MNKWNKTSEIKPKSPQTKCLVLYRLVWDDEWYVPNNICYYNQKGDSQWRFDAGRYMVPPDYWCEIEIPNFPNEENQNETNRC